MNPGRTRGLLVAVGVLVAFAVGGYGASQLLTAATPVPSDLAVQQRLMCPQCQGVRLDVCDQLICADMRADIRRRMAAGESGDSIVNSYSAVYGPAILSGAGGGSASVVVPWLLVGLGVLLLAGLGLTRTRGVPAVEPIGSAEALPLVDREMAAWRSGR